MAYLYHKVPPTLVGTHLRPLNYFKESNPSIYAHGATKYIGREGLMTRTIPIFNCLWNDVIFLSPLHPKKVFDAQFELGRTAPVTATFFEIDINLLDAKNTLVFLYPETGRFLESAYTPFNGNELEQYSELPQVTYEYFKEAIAKGENYLMYHRVPHILYKGEIDITGCNIITP